MGILRKRYNLYYTLRKTGKNGLSPGTFSLSPYAKIPELEGDQSPVLLF
jgi:hypothetical protein